MPRRLTLFCAILLATGAAAGAAVRWNEIGRQPAAWYGGEEARAIADTILLYQTPSGGWPKNTDMTKPPVPKEPGPHEVIGDVIGATIDNGATTTQLSYLARVTAATSEPRYREAAQRGIDYLFAAQYESGGWPQFFPLRPGYYTHITYNDNAMVNVLVLLREAATGSGSWSWLDAARRAKAATAVDKGVACILRTQVKQDGKLTAWCAQHDEVTFAPAWARNFEPPSLSGSETVGIVRFLMGIEKPSPAVVAAIEGAVAWLQAVPVKGLRIDSTPAADGQRDRHAVADPAAPVLWARFYELGTNRPIYTGRDKVIRYDFNEIERERRAGYSYLGGGATDLLASEYPRWRAKNKLP